MIRDAFVVFKLLFKSMFGDRYKNNKKFSPKLAGLIITICLGAYIAFLALSLSFGTAQLDNHGYVIGVFMAMSQIIILILGIFAVINILYFSKDAMLLSSLPIKSSAIFLAKITLIYLCEIGMSALISVPSLLTIGIYRAVVGATVSVGYFVYMLGAIFLLPIIPLLIISIISLPLMYVVSYLKKHSMASIIFTIILMALMFGGIFAVQIYVNSGSGFKDATDIATMLSMLSIFEMLNNVFIFNYPLRMAMTIGSAMSILWFLAYVAIALLGTAICVAISSRLYTKVLGKGLETGTDSAKKSQSIVYQPLSFKRTFLKKEWRTLLTTPALLLNLIIPVVILPIVCVILTFSMGQAVVEDPTLNSLMLYFPMMVYICLMITCFSNFQALVGFSREGKNFITLKTLPISAKEVLKLKCALSLAINVFLAIVSGVSVAIGLAVANTDGWLVLFGSLGTLVLCLIFGWAYDLIALNNDMKKLNVKWQNLSEITKKNPNIVGVQMIVVVISLVMMIIMTVGFSLLGLLGLTIIEVMAICIGVCLLIATVLLLVAIKVINKNPQKWFDEVEI